MRFASCCFLFSFFSPKFMWTWQLRCKHADLLYQILLLLIAKHSFRESSLKIKNRAIYGLFLFLHTAYARTTSEDVSRVLLGRSPLHACVRKYLNLWRSTKTRELFDVFGENSQNATRLVPRKCNQQDRVNRKPYTLCVNGSVCDEACALLHMFGRACAIFVCMPLTDEIALISVHKHTRWPGPHDVSTKIRENRFSRDFIVC